jgi:hypothetical protein
LGDRTLHTIFVWKVSAFVLSFLVVIELVFLSFFCLFVTFMQLTGYSIWFGWFIVVLGFVGYRPKGSGYNNAHYIGFSSITILCCVLFR